MCPLALCSCTSLWCIYCVLYYTCIHSCRQSLRVEYADMLSCEHAQKKGMVKKGTGTSIKVCKTNSKPGPW